MDVLNNNNIPLNWELAYVGLMRNWLTVEDVLKRINPEEIGKLSSDTIVELYSTAEDSREKFSALVKSMTNMSDDLLQFWLSVWSFAYLNNIFKSTDSIGNKLKEIANIWAMVDYPANWRNFIYYMPVDGNQPSGEEILYNNFKLFLEKENIRLKGVW
jgi:hypothetical protein